MNSVIEFMQNKIFAFDLIVFLTIIYYMAQCATKGFALSLFSFSKWLIALVATIYLVPKLNPWVQNYIEINYYSDIGLGIVIFIVSLFVIMNLGKFISSRLKWSGLGDVDKTFGLIFGIFTGLAMLLALISVLTLLPKLILIVKPFGNE